eukprot:scaffold277_cov261-Pinguiococcus_pyrenoidosus.AAC.6
MLSARLLLPPSAPEQSFCTSASVTFSCSAPLARHSASTSICSASEAMRPATSEACAARARAPRAKTLGSSIYLAWVPGAGLRLRRSPLKARAAAALSGLCGVLDTQRRFDGKFESTSSTTASDRFRQDRRKEFQPIESFVELLTAAISRYGTRK